MSDFKNVLIVLGCQPNRKGIPTKFMRNRIVKAIKLNKKNNYSKIILSGGIVRHPIPEAEIMRLLIHNSVPDSRLLLEKRSKTTVQNALFSWEILKDKKPKKVTIVTSEFHLHRTKYIFKTMFSHLGCSLRFAGAKDALTPVQYIRFLIKEKTALLYLKIHGIK